MNIDFKKAAILGAYLSKDYAKEIFRLLVRYSDVSASEAASRLDLHIKTAQSFLEGMAEVGILEKTEVIEKKRPYFRYSLVNNKIDISLDLNTLNETPTDKNNLINLKIREKNNSGVTFNTARYESYFSSVIIWHGEGRERTQRRINLTQAQGRFLFNLPFPGAEPKHVHELIKVSELKTGHQSEVLDIVSLLIEHEVIEIN